MQSIVWWNKKKNRQQQKYIWTEDMTISPFSRKVIRMCWNDFHWEVRRVRGHRKVKFRKSWMGLLGNVVVLFHHHWIEIGWMCRMCSRFNWYLWQRYTRWNSHKNIVIWLYSRSVHCQNDSAITSLGYEIRTVQIHAHPVTAHEHTNAHTFSHRKDKIVFLWRRDIKKTKLKFGMSSKIRRWR